MRLLNYLVMDRGKSYADVVRGTFLNSENEEPSPTWLRTYQREDEEEAMVEGNESVSRGNPIK